MTRSRPPRPKQHGRQDSAEALAIAALAFLASEPEHLERFLALTGIGIDDIRNAAQDRNFLTGVLDYFSGDEPLLVAFAEQQHIDPLRIERARAELGGLWERDIP